eukprot:m.37366 g.37366  ORF g.37366 m.37366 type:complete len:296 (+) comp9307_c0_seq2:776-1663(+)
MAKKAAKPKKITKNNGATAPKAKSESGGFSATSVVAIVVLASAAYYAVNNGKPADPKSVEVDGFSPYRIDTRQDMVPDPIEALKLRFNLTVLNEDPMILQFDDFLTSDECDALIELGKKAGLARSTAGMSRDLDSSRTSQTAWLTDRRLSQDPRVKVIEQRMAEACNVVPDNMEHFQVLHYDVGQFYLGHSDYIAEHQKDSCGVRLATFFVYLNDVEEGGGTKFVDLGLTVQPKRGRAALWYNSIYHNDSGKVYWTQETRTNHEATAVVKGEKWAANKWVHVKDFVNNWAKGATM